MKGRRGSILIIALWSITFLSAFAVILGSQVRQKVTLSHRLNERASLAALCDAGVKKAAALVRSQPEKSYDALKDPWSTNPGEFQDAGLGTGSLSVGYEYFDEKTGQAAMRYGLEDEERKININTADRPALTRLFVLALGIDEADAQDMAACVIDWRDADGELSLPGGGAEDLYYHGLDYPYDAGNAPFGVIDELLLVKGITQDIFVKLKGYCTIYGSGRININTAGEAALAAVGLSADMTERVLALRNGSDGVPATADDVVFESPETIVPKMSQHYSLSAEEVAQLSNAVTVSLATVSGYFTARIRARALNKRVSAEAAAVLDRQGNILYWQES